MPTSNPIAIVSAIDAHVSAPATVAPAATVAAKPAKPAKRAKPVATVTPATPAAPAAPATDVSAERIAAFDAVNGYYNGRSLPFKAASDTFAAFRTDKAPKAATTRQAALLAAMLVSGDNVSATGDFKRGGFQHNGRNVQPETGCLSDMHGRVIRHVSGPLAGKLARDAVFNINLAVARAEISANLGDKLGKLAIARIDKLTRAA